MWKYLLICILFSSLLYGCASPRDENGNVIEEGETWELVKTVVVRDYRVHPVKITRTVAHMGGLDHHDCHDEQIAQASQFEMEAAIKLRQFEPYTTGRQYCGYSYGDTCDTFHTYVYEPANSKYTTPKVAHLTILTDCVLED